MIQVPLREVADVRLVSGAAFIYRENQERYIPIKFSVRGRDLGGAVLDAQRRVAKAVPLPSGYRMEWVGELGELQQALGRLALALLGRAEALAAVLPVLIDIFARRERPLAAGEDALAPAE